MHTSSPDAEVKNCKNSCETGLLVLFTTGLNLIFVDQREFVSFQCLKVIFVITIL